MAKTLYEKMESSNRDKQIEYVPCSCCDSAFVELLNKEMEELLKNIENNEELKKLYENNSINSKGVENEKERN